MNVPTNLPPKFRILRGAEAELVKKSSRDAYIEQFIREFGFEPPEKLLNKWWPLVEEVDNAK